ncbi:FG-GAP-like repeat-containing protein [Streptomyces noursei]|uniref:Peptidase S1 domain-containing protein n=1 Tax=Streptomyces noursei TaxID=1971 RepID=A0A2N8PRB5_STRNR|nr:FG-GAP-like repeat-containing protein [Streptomyces noursei]PNE43511.1 hypothetical protein AOB60_00980 [Streptomyces noursei]
MPERHSRTVRAALLAAATVAAGLITADPATALQGTELKEGTYAFTAKLDIGAGQRSCTGALVDSQWVITASSCFASNPDKDFAVVAGVPKLKITATVGRTDLSSPSGQVSDVVELVPHAGRDLVMAKLAKPIRGVAPISVGGAALSRGEALRVMGYGRTAEEWVPGRGHSGVFTVDSVASSSIGIIGKTSGASVCKGDTGGPAFRESNGQLELIAVNSRSWQGGCFGEDESRREAVNTRVDDLGPWVQTVVSLPRQDLTAGDYDGDGITDLFTNDADGKLSVWTSRQGGSFDSPKHLTSGWDYAQTVSADFDGNGLADLIARNAKGELFIWTGDKSGSFNRPKKITDGWDFTQTVAGDFTGDGKADLIAKETSGTLYLWPGNGDGTFGAKRKLTDAWDFTQTTAADFTGDGIADLVARNSRGGELLIWIGNKGGSFNRSQKLTSGWDFTQTVAGDFTGNGKADLIAKDATGTLYRWAGRGDSTFATPTRLTDSW